MNAIMNEKGRQTKLLAAIAIIAMVVCALAVAMPSTDAASSQTQTGTSIASVAVGETTTYYDSYSEVVSAVNALEGTDDVTITILKDFDVTLSTSTATNAALWFTYTGGTITIVGGGFTIGVADSAYTANLNIIGFDTGVTASVENLKIDGLNSTTKVAHHGINIYGADVDISNVTVSGCYAAGICVNGSTVDVKTSSLSDNGWGDINVDKKSTFTIDSSSTLASNFQIWSEDAASTTGSTITAPGYVSYGWTQDGVDDGTVYFKNGVVEDLTLALGKSIVIPDGKTLTVTGEIELNGGTVTGDLVKAITDSSKIGDTFASGATVVTINTGSLSGTISGIDGELNLGDNVTVADNTVFEIGTNGSVVRNFDGETFSVQKEGGTAVATFTDFSGDAEIRVGSVYITGVGNIEGGEIVINDAAFISGNLTGQLTIKKGTSGSLTIGTSSEDNKLVVEEGAELIIDGFTGWSISSGTLDLKGTLTFTSDNTSTVTASNDGVVNTYPTTNLNNVKLAGNVEYKTDNIAYEFKGMLDQDFTISTEQSLTGDLWIPEGVTLTIASGGVLNMAGYGIYVQGTLDVQANGAIKNIGTGADGTVFGNGTILLHRNGTITNDGVIGSGSQVTVSADIRQSTEDAYGGLFVNTDLRVNYDGVGSVIMQNTSGVSFDIVNSNGTRYLTISGDINAYGTDAPYIVNVTGVRVTGELTIGDDVAFTASSGVVVTSGATVNIDGTLNAASGSFVMANGSTVNVEGLVIGAITAQTGEAVSAGFSAPGTTDITFGTGAGKDYVTGAVLTVGQVTYVENNVSYTKQILYISGNVEVVNADNDPDNDAATLTITNKDGLSYVSEGDVLDISKEVAVKGGSTIVEGQVVYIDERDAETVEGFLGTQYTIEGTSGADDVGYITTFEAAYGQIANAKDTKITVIGDMTIEIDVNLSAKQTIVVTGYNIDIDTDATVEVQRGGVITGKLNDVQGVLTVYNGAAVTAPQSYAVYKKTTDYVQYSGLVPAINNAQPGDVIDVRNNTTVKDDLTIPAGVTVNNEAVLTFEEDLVIAETAVLNNEGGEIQMVGEKSTITVNGTLDSGEGTVNFMNKNAGPDAETNPYVPATSKGADDSRSMTSVGSSVIGTESNVDEFISAAYFTNEDGYTEYTTVAKAVAAAEAMEYNVTNVVVVGTLNQSDDITLAAGTTLTIDNNAKVTLGKVTLTAGANGATGAKVVSNGELTATIAGATGVVGSTSESTVELSKAALTAQMISNTNNQNVTSDYLVISGNASVTDPVTYAPVKGAVTVATGTVNAGTIEFDGKGNTLIVATGATLAVQSIGAIDADLIVGNNEKKAAVTVEGTILFSDDGELSMDSESVMDVDGTMTVGDEMDISIVGILNVDGTLAVSTTEDKEAKVTIAANGVLAVNGTVTGAVDTVSTGYIKAYAGADLGEAIIDMVAGADEPSSDATAFYVNGELYMTIYAQSGLTFGQVMGTYDEPKEKFDLAGFVTYIPATSTSEGLNIYELSDWYTDAELSDKADNQTLAENEALYFKAPAATAEVTVSVGSGISIYIDDVRYDSGRTVTLAVGTHSVTATVNPGFTGTVNVTFNGQTVTNGQFEITADMASAAYDGVLAISATGDITQDSTVVIDGGNGSSDMGLTDYLLIILVILIVIMAIIVALRLMRS